MHKPKKNTLNYAFALPFPTGLLKQHTMMIFFIRRNMHLLEVNVSDQGLKLGPPRDGHVKGLGREEGLEVKQIEVVVVHQVCEQLVSQSVEGGHHGQGELPAAVRGAIHKPEDRDTSLQSPNMCETDLQASILLIIHLFLQM